MNPQYDPKNPHYLKDPATILIFRRMVVVTDGIESSPLIPYLVQGTQQDFVTRSFERAISENIQAMDVTPICIWDEEIVPEWVLENLYPGYDGEHPDRVNSDVKVIECPQV